MLRPYNRPSPRETPRGTHSTASPTDPGPAKRSEEHTSELQSQSNLVCRLLLEKKTKTSDMLHIVHIVPHRTMRYPTSLIHDNNRLSTSLVHMSSLTRDHLSPLHTTPGTRPWAP